MQFDTSSLWIYLYLPNLQLNIQQIQTEAINMSCSTDNRRKRKIQYELGQQQGTEQIELKKTSAQIIYHPKLNQILQLNNEAQKLGIKVGMGLASASILCSSLAVSEYKEAIALQALQELANQLYLVTSDIVIDEPCGLYLRAQNMLRLYGGLADYWQVICEVINKQGYDFYYASAFSVNAAKLIAKHQQKFINNDKALIHQQLQQCSLLLTDIDKKDIERLHRIGIKCIADLFEQPLSALASRVSKFSLQIMSELRGESAAKLRFYQPPKRYEHYLEVLYDIQLTARLLPVIRKCLDALEAYLLVRNGLALSLQITLYQREHEPIIQVINSALPIYKSVLWLDIIALRFEHLALSSGVYGINLKCERIEQAGVSESDFFNEKSTQIAAMTLISRLKAKLGEPQVQLMQYCDDHRPERCTQLSAQAVNQSSNKGANEGFNKSLNKASNNSLQNKPSIPAHFLDRPGFLLKKPIQLNSKVSIIDGPERVVSGWWDNHMIQRDYFLAQSDQGQQMWIFRTRDDQWFIHGYFI
ncbi:MAG: protein ImuB [Glaciecola sp.]|jgi:protein ImuB